MPDTIFDRHRRLAPDIDRDEPDDETGGLVDLAEPLSLGDGITIDPATGDISIATEDGGVMVQLDPPDEEEEEEDDGRFYQNLAGKISDEERGRLVEDVLRGIEADDQSRQSWLENRAEGIKMLGVELERSGGDVGNSTGPFEGMSTVRHPLLLEAVARGQFNAAAELYPPTGPVKVRDDRPSKPTGLPPQLGHNGGPPLDADDPMVTAEVFAADQAGREDLADALEKGFNHNLTVVDRGYRPDSVRMLFWVFFGGCAFKKIYDCPIKQRPVSRFVDAADIIVSNAVSDHRDAGRITHRSVMRPALVRRMQIAGVYRDIELHEPQFAPNAVEMATAAVQGLDAMPQRQEDQPRTIYESYVELDIKGYEHKHNRKPTGIPLPWKVTIDKDARELLELRRNWDEDDDTYEARQVFVKFSFMPAMGFYDLGLLHLLGNGDRALTAAWRIALDTGMFSNFPGFIYNEGVIRNWTNQNRVPPGGGIGIKTAANVPLNNVIQPLPYKDVSQGLIALITHVEQRMDRVGGLGDIPVGEGRADAPVGTTLALIEQATKILAGVHVNLHEAQAEEFQILKARYRENPEAFWRWNKKGPAWEKEEFLRALEDHEIVPAADPNTPSHLQRIMKAQALKQMAMALPQMYDMEKIDKWIMRQIGISDPDQFFAPSNGAPPPDPMLAAAQMQAQVKMQEITAKAEAEKAKLAMQMQEAAAKHQASMAELAGEQQLRSKEHEQDAQEAALASADRAADRQSEERRQMLKIQAELLKNQQQTEHQRQTQSRQQQHDAMTQARDQTHEHIQGIQDRAHERQQTGLDQTHEAILGSHDRQAQLLQQGLDQRHQMTQQDLDRQHAIEQQEATQEHERAQAETAAKAARAQGLAKPPRKGK